MDETLIFKAGLVLWQTSQDKSAERTIRTQNDPLFKVKFEHVA